MSDVKYDAELCERLEREARAIGAKLAAGVGVKAVTSNFLPTLLALADQLEAARAEIEYWQAGTALIEECLAKATKANPGDVPFPIVGDEARNWHTAQENAYRHALEMMGRPTVDAYRTARSKAGKP